MKSALRQFVGSVQQMRRNRFFQIASAICLLLIAATFAWPLIQLFPEITEQIAVPLHYNVHFGVDSFGHWGWIFMVPTLNGAFFLLNTALAVFLWRKDPVLSYFAFCVSLTSATLFTLAIIHIVSLNLTYYG